MSKILTPLFISQNQYLKRLISLFTS